MISSLNNPGDFPSEKEPNTLLLLKPEQEKQIRNEIADEPYVYEFEAFGRKLKILGIQHTRKNDGSLRKEFESFVPDFVLVEGNPAARGLEKDLDTAFRMGGETSGVLYLATESGKDIPVESWDSEEFQRELTIPRAFEHFSEDAVMGFVLGVVAGHVLEGKGEPATYVNIRKFIENEGGTYLKDLDESLLSESFLERLSVKYTGKKLEDLSIADANDLRDPSGSGETNAVNRWMIGLRDPYAVKKIWGQVMKNKRVFVVAGRSHAITWKPVFEDLMGRPSS